MMNSVLVFAVVVLFIMVVCLVIAFMALSRQVGVLFERITPVGAMINNNGPVIGEETPKFKLKTIDGYDVEIGGKQNKSTLVFFVSPSCPICKALLPALKDIYKAESNWLSVILASDGDEKKQRDFVSQYDLTGLPYVLSQELGMAYRVAKLPFSVLVDENGLIVSKGLVNNREQLESLFSAKETSYQSMQDFVQKNSEAI